MILLKVTPFSIHKTQADTRDKAVKMMNRTNNEDESEKRKKVAAAAFDTLLWQVRFKKI
jgi:hypothetical protein